MNLLLLNTQLSAYKAELAIVNAKLVDMLDTGEEFEVGTSAGLNNRVRQVPYAALAKRQQELENKIQDLEVALGLETSSKVSYVR